MAKPHRAGGASEASGAGAARPRDRERRALVNGVAGAGIPPDDPGFTRGLNVFDTLRTYGEAIFRLEKHLERLDASAKAMGIPAPDRDVLLSEIEQVRGPEVIIRITLTGGGNRVVAVAPIEQAKVGRPVRCARVDMRPNPYLPGHVKHGSRAAWVLAAQHLGVDEVLFVDPAGHILEANRSNVFAVVDGTLWTPPADLALVGVTRGALLDAAAEAGLPLTVAPLPARSEFQELYLSSTLKELAPVIELDGVPVGGGPLGARLHQALRDLIKRETATPG